MKRILFSLVAIVSSAWYLDLAATTFPANSAVLWIAHRTLPAAYEARLAGKRVIYRPGVEQA